MMAHEHVATIKPISLIYYNSFSCLIFISSYVEIISSLGDQFILDRTLLTSIVAGRNVFIQRYRRRLSFDLYAVLLIYDVSEQT
jgi:hypothetical protein